MKTGTLFSAASMFLCVVLLVLSGVFPGARHGSAQTREACPLPAGATPVALPLVTARQVENDPGLLRDFALSVRERSREHARQAMTVEQGLYIGCLVRQEGSAWRSGSTYIVSLTPDGRLFLHAKDMALAGRLLNPLIYAEILAALGVSPVELANLASPDPDTRNSAFAAIFATLSQEPDGAFDATAPVPGVRPAIPGASGYASVYVSPNLGAPIVLLAGFDLGESHLVPVSAEAIDYGDPAITARDVVDRETLKAFVTQAGNYILELQRTGDAAAASKARIALRDPNGPWRRGSVYLYVLDTVTNVITFHAAFPDRFENRPLVPTVRDAVTGEFILPQVIKAAKSSPEGGFVEYYFDDPADDADSADIPKLGYAREFASQIQRTDGSTIPVNLIVGSGFYGTAPGAIASHQSTVVDTVLPQVMRAMTASTVDAVSGRIRQATSDAPPATGLKIGGASTLYDALSANGRALENGTFDLSRLLAGSSFSLPLDLAGAEGNGPFGNLTLWGSGDYRNFSGGNRQTLDYDGDVVSANLGIDTKLSADLLAGMSVARARGTVDYTDSSALTGELTTTLTSINPYIGWQTPGDMNLWATAGYGWGEVEVHDSTGTQESDLTQQMLAAGVGGPLVASDQVIEGGTTSVRLKGETAFTWADIDGSGALQSTMLNASRQRLMLEGIHDQKLSSGATLSPSLEIGMRHDGGDGETGNSIETGGGLRYADAATGLTVEGRARTLLAHSGDYEEWGVSGLVRLDPGAAGQGLAFSLQPAWGQTASGVQRLWETDAAAGASPADQAAARVNARVAYSIGVARGSQCVLTPYTGVSLSEEGYRRVSVGGRYNIGQSIRMSLEGAHSQPARSATNQTVMLQGHLNW